MIVGKEASTADRKAAAELQKYVEIISGARIPILTDDTTSQPKEIVIGKTKRSQQSGLEVAWDTLEEDGFIPLTISSPKKNILKSILNFF